MSGTAISATHDRCCRKKFVIRIVTDEFNVGISKWRSLHDTEHTERYSEQALVQPANSERVGPWHEMGCLCRIAATPPRRFLDRSSETCLDTDPVPYTGLSLEP
jgi:hypothetical protein